MTQVDVELGAEYYAQFVSIFDPSVKYSTFNPGLVENHFIYDTLSRIAGSVSRHRCFYSEEIQHTVSVFHTATNICGHKGICHGGLSAALLDNSFGQLGFITLKTPVTKSLEMQYKSPIMANDIIIISCKTGPSFTKGDKKAELIGEIYAVTLNQDEGTPVGRLCVLGKAVMVDVSDRNWGKQTSQNNSGEPNK